MPFLCTTLSTDSVDVHSRCWETINEWYRARARVIYVLRTTFWLGTPIESTHVFWDGDTTQPRFRYALTGDAIAPSDDRKLFNALRRFIRAEERDRRRRDALIKQVEAVQLRQKNWRPAVPVENAVPPARVVKRAT